MNKNLHSAKKAKNDEFYTLITDIEKELLNYKSQFKDKIVMLPCDDIELMKGKGIDINNDGVVTPEEMMSQFWVYFHKNFKYLGIKKLIATAYSSDKMMHKVEYNGGDDNDVTALIRTPLKTNGDFRSDEVKELMKQADVIVTNPPFSLFREFIAQLEELNKKFLLVGNKNAITYKETFKLIKENKLWLGYNLVKKFLKPNGDTQTFGNIGWFTNLTVNKSKSDLVLTQTYEGNESNYPKYDNYNAINVDKVKDIPKDYDGAMGVPITFLDKWTPSSDFEIIALGIQGSISFTKNIEMEVLKTGKKTKNAKGTLYIKHNDEPNKEPKFKNIKTGELYNSKYARIIIRRIK